MLVRTAREAERGQTLPIWTFAIFTSLALMFFTLNYANVVRAQVRAQTVADMLVQTMLSVQATRWNKLTMALYAADVEEWRIRNLLQGMLVAANSSGPCAAAGSCLTIYNALVPQYYKAVTRYKADAYAIDALSYQPSYYFEGNNENEGMRASSEIACEHTPVVSSECGTFTYHTINYGYRSTSTLQTVTKDAFYATVGGAATIAPAVNWQPIEIEVSVCQTVNPVAKFSLFGVLQPVQIVGRAAATMAPITTEWLAPGVTANPNNSNGNPLFQEPETYSSADTFGSVPRDWYGTSFPAQPYTAVSPTSYGMTGSALAPDFEVWVPWWGVIPILPYTTTAQTPAMLCTADPSMSD